MGAAGGNFTFADGHCAWQPLPTVNFVNGVLAGQWCYGGSP